MRTRSPFHLLRMAKRSHWRGDEQYTWYYLILWAEAADIRAGLADELTVRQFRGII